jgi:hypothetical protein
MISRKRNLITVVYPKDDYGYAKYIREETGLDHFTVLDLLHERCIGLNYGVMKCYSVMQFEVLEDEMRNLLNRHGVDDGLSVEKSRLVMHHIDIDNVDTAVYEWDLETPYNSEVPFDINNYKLIYDTRMGAIPENW